MGMKELMKEWGLEDSKITDVLGKAETYFGAVSSIISIYSTLTKVIEWLNGGGTDQLAVIDSKIDLLRQELNAGFDELNESADRDRWHDHHKSVEGELSNARSALGQALYLKDDIASHQDLVFSELGNANTAVNTLATAGYWLRPNVLPTIYSDPWSGDVNVNADGDGLGTKGPLKEVYHHLMTLHAYVDALANQVLVLALHEISATSDQARSEASVRAQFLNTQHDKIRDAITPVRTPTKSDVVSYYERPYFDADWELKWSRWDQLGRTYGAIEYYCGVNNVERFPAFSFPAPPKPPKDVMEVVEDMLERQPPYKTALAIYQRNLDLAYPKFHLIHRLATKSKQKSLYRSLGLDAVRRVVDHLRRMAGEGPLGRDSYPLWSLRTIAGVVREITPDFGDDKVGVRALAEWIRGKGFTEVRFTIIKMLNPRDPMDEVVLVGVDG